MKKLELRKKPTTAAANAAEPTEPATTAPALDESEFCWAARGVSQSALPPDSELGCHPSELRAAYPTDKQRRRAQIAQPSLRQQCEDVFSALLTDTSAREIEQRRTAAAVAAAEAAALAKAQAKTSAAPLEGYFVENEQNCSVLEEPAAAEPAEPAAVSEPAQPAVPASEPAVQNPPPYGEIIVGSSGAPLGEKDLSLFAAAAALVSAPAASAPAVLAADPSAESAALDAPAASKKAASAAESAKTPAPKRAKKRPASSGADSVQTTGAAEPATGKKPSAGGKAAASAAELFSGSLFEGLDF